MIRDTADGPVVAPEIPTRTRHNARLKVGSTTDQRVRDGTTFSRVVLWPRQAFLPLLSWFSGPYSIPAVVPYRLGSASDRIVRSPRGALHIRPLHTTTTFRIAEKNVRPPGVDDEYYGEIRDATSSTLFDETIPSSILVVYVRGNEINGSSLSNVDRWFSPL